MAGNVDTGPNMGDVRMNLSKTRQMLLVAVILTLCGVGAAASQTAIKIGYPLAVNAEIPVTIQNAGIDRKHGLAGEFVTFQNGPPMFEALASGSLDLVMTSILPTLVFLSKLPNDFLIIAAPGESTSALLVAPSSNFSSLGDLRGKRIAVSFGSSQYLDLLRALAEIKMDKSDVVLLNMSPSDLPLALERNLTDAIVAFQPQTVRLKKDFGARALQSWPFYYVIGVRRSFVEANPGVEPKIREMLGDAMSFMSSNRDQTERWLAAALKVDQSTIVAIEADDVAALRDFVKYSEIGISPDFKKVFAEWADTTLRLGLIKKPVKLDGIFH